MDRRLYSNYFSDCVYNLSNEVTQLYDLKQCINSALASDASSEFSNAYLREKYNTILQSINEKNNSIINHQIYLSKRKAYLNKDDSDKAKSLDLRMDNFQIVRTKISQMAQDMYESAYALAGGDIGLEAIISKEELRVSIAINEELGNLTYDEFFAMGENDRNEIVNKAIDLANKYVLDGTLPIPENGRIELPIAPGVTIYCTSSTYATIGNSNVAVDYNPASRDVCLHILGGDKFVNMDVSAEKIPEIFKKKKDKFANTDVGIDTDLRYGITYMEPINENSFIYVASGYDIETDAFFAEKGVSVTTNPATAKGASINTTCTVACGVEVSRPSGWTPKPQKKPVPVIEVNYNLIPDFDEQLVPGEVVVLGALLLIGGGAATLAKLLPFL